MKSYTQRLQAAVLAGLLLCGVNAFAMTDLYQSDFAHSKMDWTGRPSSNSVPPALKLDTCSAQAAVTLMTDGKVGCGFHWKAPLDLNLEKVYRVTFKFRKTAPIPVTYRVTTSDGTRAGEENKNWINITYSARDMGQWVEVEHLFRPAVEKVGIDIAAGADHAGNPFEMSIADFKITEL